MASRNKKPRSGPSAAPRKDARGRPPRVFSDIEKNKYLGHIRIGGGRCGAARIAGVANQTFEAFIARDAEFREAVEAAEQERHENVVEAQIGLAIDRDKEMIVDYLNRRQAAREFQLKKKLAFLDRKLKLRELEIRLETEMARARAMMRAVADSVGEPDKSEEFRDADPDDLAAIEAILSRVAARSAGGPVEVPPA